jgi:hypothetical protein
MQKREAGKRSTETGSDNGKEDSGKQQQIKKGSEGTKDKREEITTAPTDVAFRRLHQGNTKQTQK